MGFIFYESTHSKTQANIFIFAFKICKYSYLSGGETFRVGDVRVGPRIPHTLLFLHEQDHRLAVRHGNRLELLVSNTCGHT